ncbi:hypothetical protein D3C80_2086440 [compost metagenome]
MKSLIQPFSIFGVAKNLKSLVFRMKKPVLNYRDNPLISGLKKSTIVVSPKLIQNLQLICLMVMD